MGANELLPGSAGKYVNGMARPTHRSVLHLVVVSHQPLQTTTIGVTAFRLAGAWMLAVAEALMSGLSAFPNGSTTPPGGGLATTVTAVAVWFGGGTITPGQF